MISPICLEGPDGVGKTTLAAFMGGPGGYLAENKTNGGVYDRCWVTNLIYRSCMPLYDWSQYTDNVGIISLSNVDLVILLPGDRENDKLYETINKDHGYTKDDYKLVTAGYRIFNNLSLAQQGLFKSVSVLMWENNNLYPVSFTHEHGLAAAKPTITATKVMLAAKEYNNAKKETK